MPNGSGQFFNNKCGGISKRKKSYHVRDIYWLKKHVICVRSTSKCGKTAPKKIGPHGANQRELDHSTITGTYKYIPRCPVYWEFIPSTEVKMIFCLMMKNTKSLFDKFKKNRSNFTEQHVNLMNEIKQIHRDYTELKALRKGLDIFGHGWLWFDKIDRSLNEWFKDCDPNTCVSKVSKLWADDFTTLMILVYNSEQTNYGNFTNINDIVSNNKTMSWLQKQLQHRMTINEIKEFLAKEWSTNASSFHQAFDTSSEEEEEEEVLEIPSRFGSRKKKSLSEEYVISEILINI